MVVGRDQNDGMGRCGTHLPPQSIKIHLPMEPFSLKTNWRLAETLLYTKVVRKIHTQSGRKGKGAIRVGPVLLQGDTEEEGDYTSSRAVKNLDFTHEEQVHTCLLPKQGRESRLK